MYIKEAYPYKKKNYIMERYDTHVVTYNLQNIKNASHYRISQGRG